MKAVNAGDAEDIGEKELAARFVDELQSDGIGKELVRVGENLQSAEIEDFGDRAGKGHRFLHVVVDSSSD